MVDQPVLGSVDRQVSSCAQLVTTHMLELLVLLAEPEVRVRGHDPVVLRKVLQLDGSRGLNDRVREGDAVHRRTSSGDMMSCGLVTAATLEFPEDDEGEEDDDKQDDGDGDADQDSRVVGIGGDGLRPGGLGELVSAGVGADLRKREFY